MAPPETSQNAKSEAESGFSPFYQRRSSGSTPKFANLMNHKRNSLDATAQARRRSFAEQKPEAGIFGTWWNKHMTGYDGSKQ